MELDPKIAESIVTNLKDVVQHEINLFDSGGTVIASTDASRVGTKHEAAQLAARTGQTVEVTDNSQFRGARHGINVPVLFNGSVAAVVGITGELDQVAPFGTVIGKMTEILIRENNEQIVRFDQRERFSNLVNILVLKHHDSGLVDYLASTMNIDFSVPRLAVVGNIDGDRQAGEELYAIVYAHLSSEANTFFSLSDQQLRIFTDVDGNRLNSILRPLQVELGAKLKHPVSFGTGNQVVGEKQYWHSFDEAQRALSWELFVGGGAIRRFDTLDEAILMTAVPRDEAERLVNHVFGDIPADQLDEFQRVFDSYTRNNGSIKRCAEELFVHKNTLQNHLNKIALVTGYNPRELADYHVLSIAFKLRAYLAFTKTRHA